MSTTYSLILPGRRIISEEEASDSGRHGSIGFVKGWECRFVGSADRLYFVQEYALAAGEPAEAFSEEYIEGPNPTKGYAARPLDAIVTMLHAEHPDTPVTLIAGEANLSSCRHERPCGPNPVSHACRWTETEKVDADVCDVCPHFKGEAPPVYGANIPWKAIRCGHPDAWRNLLAKDPE